LTAIMRVPVAASVFCSVLCAGIPFFQESFDGDVFSTGKWTLSAAEKYSKQALLIKAPAHSDDPGLQLVEENRFYCVGAEFPTVLDPRDQEGLVLQYDLKFEETLGCGGAYLKMPRKTDEFSMGSMHDESPYSIMFGPDKCGHSNKIHFIIQHQSPVTGKWEEKHLNETVPFPVDKKSHLYTLWLKRDNSFAIYVDRKEVAAGSLLTHLRPPVNPPTEISDPADFKPADWVDAQQIPDPAANKPADWDENEPALVTDISATKPERWEEEAPEIIPDPAASRPEDWDDAEDGEWEAPTIANPICSAPKGGCGKWSQPQIRNPKYRGKWSAPVVDNPAYKGPWVARHIANPEYFEDMNPFALHPMAALAIEVWTVNAGIHFDNFFVGFSLAEAFESAGASALINLRTYSLMMNYRVYIRSQVSRGRGARGC
jgi:calnexin